MPNIVKITTILNPLELLAPHSCRGCGRLGSPLCDCCKNYILKQHFNFCPVCKAKNQNGKCNKHRSLPPIFTAGYRHGLIDQLIHELKYNSVRAAARPLADILSHIAPNLPNQAIIVPLPTISKHIRTRGLNHTHLIAKHLSRQQKTSQIQNLLIRVKNTVQVGASRKTRLVQANSAYGLNPKIKISPDATYVLLDDVWTTGASMLSAIKKLQQAGANKIIVLVLAVSELQD